MKKKLAVLVLLFALMLPCRCLASSVQIHPPWGQDGDKLYVSAFGKDRYLIVKTRTSAAINAAIDALGAEGGEVFCPEGTYAITTQVTYDADNTTIRGTTGTVFVMGADIHGVYATNLDNIKLINIEINGNDYDQTTNFLVRFVSVENASIEGCTFYNFKNYGVSINITHTSTRPNNGTLSNCIFRSASDTSSTALTIASESAYGSTVNVINCTFSQCDIGIFYNVGHFLIQGCDFIDNTDDAIYSNNTFSPCDYGRISNCHFFNNDGDDIALLSNTPIGWTLSNNTFFGNDSISVTLTGYNHTLRGNVFSEPREVSECIRVSGWYHVITDNTFKLEASDADYCIYLDSTNYCIITDNNLDTSVTTGHTVYKTSSDVSPVISGNINYTTNYSGREGLYEIPGPVRIGGTDYDTKTDNYVITTSDFGKTLSMNSASDKTFSLPSVDSYNDGSLTKLCKMGTGKVTIDAADSDYIFDSGAGDGIYTTSNYAFIILEYHDDDTRWYIVHAVGTWVTYD